MIGRFVRANAQSDANTGAGTEMLVTAGGGAAVVVERAALSQTSQATSEQAEAALQRYPTIASSGGDAVTEVANDSTATISTAVTVEGTIAISEGTGTPTEFYTQGWNLLSGFLWTPESPDAGILCDLSETLDIAIPTTQTSLSWDCSVHFREFGT